MFLKGKKEWKKHNPNSCADWSWWSALTNKAFIWWGKKLKPKSA